MNRPKYFKIMNGPCSEISHNTHTHKHTDNYTVIICSDKQRVVNLVHVSTFFVHLQGAVQQIYIYIHTLMASCNIMCTSEYTSYMFRHFYLCYNYPLMYFSLSNTSMKMSIKDKLTGLLPIGCH